jgi:hypothetical protein
VEGQPDGWAPQASREAVGADHLRENAGLMGQTVVRTSLLRHVLPLKVRAFPMWDYIRISHSGVVSVPPSSRGVWMHL